MRELTAVQFLNRVIAIADRIMAREHGAIDLLDELWMQQIEIQRRQAQPAEGVRTVGDAEVILNCSLLHQIGIPSISAVDRQRCRAIAEQALPMVRDHLFIAMEQERRPTP